MYMFIRKYTKVRSVADAARRAKSGIGQILRQSHGFRSYYILDGGEGVGVAVMMFEDRESANAANDRERSMMYFRKRQAVLRSLTVLLLLSDCGGGEPECDSLDTRNS